MSQHSPNTPQTPLLGGGILLWFGILPYSARVPHLPQFWLHGGSAQFALGLRGGKSGAAPSAKAHGVAS